MSGSAVADIRDTYGIAFIGLFLSTILYGVTTTQTWIYYCHYRGRDPMMLKAFVVTLFVLDTLHTVLCIYAVYWYLILNFGNVANLDLTMWAINVQTDVNGLVGFLVQVFYARRVYIMSKSIVIPLVIVTLGGLCFTLGFVFTAQSFALERFSRLGSLIWVTCVGMSSAALADILIALAMCWYLHRKRTGFPKTDSMIITLMTYSINSGLLTSVLATAMLVSFVAWRSSLLFELFFWLMGKCYVNSFLAFLNSRDILRERPSDNSWSNAIHMPSVRQSKAPYNLKSGTGSTAVAVSVHQTATTDFAATKHDYDGPELQKSEGMTISSVHDGSQALTV